MSHKAGRKLVAKWDGKTASFVNKGHYKGKRHLGRFRTWSFHQRLFVEAYQNTKMSSELIRFSCPSSPFWVSTINARGLIKEIPLWKTTLSMISSPAETRSPENTIAKCWEACTTEQSCWPGVAHRDAPDARRVVKIVTVNMVLVKMLSVLAVQTYLNYKIDTLWKFPSSLCREKKKRMQACTLPGQTNVATWI